MCKYESNFYRFGLIAHLIVTPIGTQSYSASMIHVSYVYLVVLLSCAFIAVLS